METGGILNFDVIRAMAACSDPYPHLAAGNVIRNERRTELGADFPDITRPGFFPLSEMTVRGAFGALIDEFTSDEFSALLGEKLGLDLNGKPRLVTVRKWSAAKDGRIHNDSESKLASALIYLNDEWPHTGAGCFRVLKSKETFEEYACEVAPTTGAMIAFQRTENSWHGHLPFAGERRVVQLAWLRSQEDFDRKQRRGRVSMLLKKMNPFGRVG